MYIYYIMQYTCIMEIRKTVLLDIREIMTLTF